MGFGMLENAAERGFHFPVTRSQRGEKKIDLATCARNLALASPMRVTLRRIIWRMVARDGPESFFWVVTLTLGTILPHLPD